MNVDPDDKSGAIEAGSEPQTSPIPPDHPRKRKRKFNKTKPLDSPEEITCLNFSVLSFL